MPPRNVRRPITDHYDPKQRIVGGIVLFLLMLLIYSLLKLVLGFSYVPEGRFEIGAPLTAEILSSPSGLDKKQTLRATDSSIASPQITYPLPSGFVFLDLKGNPMQKEVYQAAAPAGSAEIYTTATSGEEKWYVQAASFKEEALAQNLVQKIKDNHIATEANIVQSSNGWYVVRLPPQSEQEKAKQQHKQLRDVLRIHGIIKKLN
jgi:hypothetical protein